MKPFNNGQHQIAVSPINSPMHNRALRITNALPWPHYRHGSIGEATCIADIYSPHSPCYKSSHCAPMTQLAHLLRYLQATHTPVACSTPQAPQSIIAALPDLQPCLVCLLNKQHPNPNLPASSMAGAYELALIRCHACSICTHAPFLRPMLFLRLPSCYQVTGGHG